MKEKKKTQEEGKLIKTFFAPNDFHDLFLYSTKSLREHGQIILSIGLRADRSTPNLKTRFNVPIGAGSLSGRRKAMVLTLEQRQRVRGTIHFTNTKIQSIDNFIQFIRDCNVQDMQWRIKNLTLVNADNNKITSWKLQKVNGKIRLMCYKVDDITVDELEYGDIIDAVGDFYEDACQVYAIKRKDIGWRNLPCKV